MIEWIEHDGSDVDPTGGTAIVTAMYKQGYASFGRWAINEDWSKIEKYSVEHYLEGTYVKK